MRKKQIRQNNPRVRASFFILKLSYTDVVKLCVDTDLRSVFNFMPQIINRYKSRKKIQYTVKNV